MEQQHISASNYHLQQLITNAVRSALTGGGIESNTTEAVSTAPSSLTALMSKKACDRRLKNLKVKR